MSEGAAAAAPRTTGSLDSLTPPKDSLMSNDQTLSPDPATVDPTPPTTVFGTPNDEPTKTPEAIVRPLTFDEVLQTARRPERRAKFCLRADLQAEHDTILDELATLVGPDGRLLEQPHDDETSLADSAEARAQDLAARLDQVQSQMRDAMRYVRFRGLPSDELSTFNKRWEPKDKKSDRTEYNYRLVAQCAVEPELTYDQVRTMAANLGTGAMYELVTNAINVCYDGGVAVPKSPMLSLPPREQ